MRCILSLLLLAPMIYAADPVYKVGLASQVITPPEPIWMAGYGGRKEPAKGKQHDLWAKAMAVEDTKGNRFVLLTSDLCGIPRNLSVDICDAVTKKTGLKREEILLTCSHTHSGPVVRENLMDMYDMPNAEREKVKAYYPLIRDWMVGVIVKAVGDMQPALLDIGEGKAGFAMNRREAKEKGVVIGSNPTGPVDHAVPVLRVRKPNGELRAAVFGYACHNTTLDGLEWSGDYAGFAQIAFEKAHPGAMGLFWIGCGADANPMPRRKVEFAQDYGEKLAGAVSDVLKSGKMTELGTTITTRFGEQSLDFHEIPTREKLLTDAASKTFAVQTRANRFLREIAAGKPIAPSYANYPVQVVRFGDQLDWIALGGEVVVDYALRLKKDAKRPTWVTAYANDVMAYIPSERVLKEGGYEADSSMIYYGQPSKWKAGLEDKIIGAVEGMRGAR